MEFISKIRWVIIVFVVLVALILVGWGLSAIARSVFNEQPSTSMTETEAIDVRDLKTVSLTVDGPVVASEDHRSYTIEVSRNVVSMKVFSDYGQTVIAEKGYINNDEAYESLAQSLNKAGASLRLSTAAAEDDYNHTGSCPTGKRYILDLGDTERRWGTSCQTITGTAGGNMSVIRKLFEKQIPDFNDLIVGTNLR